MSGPRVAALVSVYRKHAHAQHIVDRFLEHGRIYYFQNGGEEEYYIGSADCMKRNLESRVECVVSIEDPRLKDELRFTIDAQLDDSRSAWEMQADGTYLQRVPPGGRKGKSSQQMLIERAEKTHKEATRLRRRRPQGIARRSARWMWPSAQATATSG